MFLMAFGVRRAVRREMPAFVAEIQRTLSAKEIRNFLDHLERAKYLAPADPDLEINDLDNEIEDESRQENPVIGAEELLRFLPPATASPAGALIMRRLLPTAP